MYYFCHFLSLSIFFFSCFGHEAVQFHLSLNHIKLSESERVASGSWNHSSSLRSSNYSRFSNASRLSVSDVSVFEPSASSTSAALISPQAAAPSRCVHASETGFPHFLPHTCEEEGNPCSIVPCPCCAYENVPSFLMREGCDLQFG